MSSEQSESQTALFDEQTVEREAPATVWVVAGNYADDPHPHILAVYDNEEAAREHEKAIRDSIKPSEPIAWDVFEKEIDQSPLRERRSKVNA